jgi:hypothetical protein
MLYVFRKYLPTIIGKCSQNIVPVIALAGTLDWKEHGAWYYA